MSNEQKVLSSVELKAMAYDTLAQIENLQNQLRNINDAIGKAYVSEKQALSVVPQEESTVVTDDLAQGS